MIGRHMMVAAAIAASVSAAPALADVRAGIDAWQAGKYDQAVKEWRPLADKGDPDAQFNMGQAYKLGRGVPADMKLAQVWYEKAAARGHEQAQTNLGLILYQNGNKAGAMTLIRKAADRGDARAQYVLGTELFNGGVVAKDWPRAYALMVRAADQGLPQAKSSLVQMDEFIPASDRERGRTIAQQLQRGSQLASAAPPPIVSGTKPAQVASASAKPATAKSAAAKSAAPKPVAVAGGKPVPGPAKGDAPGDKSAAAAVQTAKLKAPATPAAKPVVASGGGRWRVQLGAYSNAGAARAQWSAISKKIGALGGLQPSYEPAGALTRLRVGPLASRADANKLCASAKAAGQACIPIAP